MWNVNENGLLAYRILPALDCAVPLAELLQINVAFSFPVGSDVSGLGFIVPFYFKSRLERCRISLWLLKSLLFLPRALSAVDIDCNTYLFTLAFWFILVWFLLHATITVSQYVCCVYVRPNCGRLNTFRVVGKWQKISNWYLANMYIGWQTKVEFGTLLNFNV